MAESQGQKIFKITNANIANVLPQLSHNQATKGEIINAVNAGNEVTISEARITQNGWTGLGYFIVDPDTGAGSYLIDGKANGGALFIVFFLAFVALFLVALGAWIVALGIIALVIEVIILADLPFNAFIFAIARFIGQAILFGLAIAGAGLPYLLATIALFVAEFFWLMKRAKLSIPTESQILNARMTTNTKQIV